VGSSFKAGRGSRWLAKPFSLLDNLPDETWDVLTAFGVGLVFVGLMALVLWPLEKARLALSFAKSYGIFWLVVHIVFLLLSTIQRVLGISLYDRINAYVASGLAVNSFLIMGWSAFAALTLPGFLEGTAVWVAVIIWMFAFLSTCIAWLIAASYFRGHIYKLVALPLAVASLLVFALWPAGARSIYGWFFRFF
jgi:hypothetical protein